jgi:hypothetical protein
MELKHPLNSVVNGQFYLDITINFPPKMTYNYQDNIKELRELANIPLADIFNYEDSPIQYLYAKYFQFCQENLSEQCHQFDIKPARFYYRSEFDINARAGKHNGYSIIGMNMGTIHSLYQTFYVQNHTFEKDKHLINSYRELGAKFDVPPGHLMFQLAILFTFYHERAHLIQKSTILSSGLSEKPYELEQSEFNIERHILEIDADLDAAYYICSHLFEYWRKLPEKDQTGENLQKILAIGVAGIFSYFLLYFNQPVEIYYDKHTHPHPLIRITYILDRMIQFAQQYLMESTSIRLQRSVRDYLLQESTLKVYPTRTSFKFTLTSS